jgi:hypothetical protein
MSKTVKKCYVVKILKKYTVAASIIYIKKYLFSVLFTEDC